MAVAMQPPKLGSTPRSVSVNVPTDWPRASSDPSRRASAGKNFISGFYAAGRGFSSRVLVNQSFFEKSLETDVLLRDAGLRKSGLRRELGELPDRVGAL